MSGDEDDAPGARIARARRRRGLSQVERGKRSIDSHAVLTRRTREVITSLLRREHQPSTPELRPSHDGPG